MATPRFPAPAIALGVAAVAAFPLLGIGLLWKSARANDVTSLRARAAGVLLVTAPTLWVLTGVLAEVSGFGSEPRVPFWLGFWILGAASMFWRASEPRTLLASGAARRVRNVHRALVALIILFSAAHLAVNLTAWHSLETYDRAATWLRLLYRTPAAEPILLAAFAIQLASGLLLALDAAFARSTFEHLCQVTAGLVLGTFVTSHTLAVAVLGRGLLDRGPDFTFASAGPGGLLSSVDGAELAPYYTLAVLALAIHLVRPLRLAILRIGGGRIARLVAPALLTTALVATAIIVRALLAPHAR
jgi:hypothetical protein